MTYNYLIFQFHINWMSKKEEYELDDLSKDEIELLRSYGGLKSIFNKNELNLKKALKNLMDCYKSR